MGFRVVYFILWLVYQFLRGGELNMAWNREKKRVRHDLLRDYWSPFTLLEYYYTH